VTSREGFKNGPNKSIFLTQLFFNKKTTTTITTTTTLIGFDTTEINILSNFVDFVILAEGLKMAMHHV